MSYISVRGWRRFQHYRDRIPPWVKMYTELLDDDDFRALTFAQRGLLADIWKAYAKSRCTLRGDTAALTRRFGQRVLSSHMEALIHAGFIELVASKTLAEGYQDASPEVEEEKDKETPKPPFRIEPKAGELVPFMPPEIRAQVDRLAGRTA